MHDRAEQTCTSKWEGVVVSPVMYHKGLFPPSNIRWSELIPFLGPTAASVARYDSMLRAIPNPDILIAPLATHEAVLSSRIEGTIASMSEVLEFDAGHNSPPAPGGRREEYREILNYRRALYTAERHLETIPLSQRVILEAHRTLLSGTRSQDKEPGSYRRISNWIGRPGCSVEEARFVPISAACLPDAMSAWEKYLHSDATPDQFVKLAVLHAEFEAIHPFLDGNGRVGRMIIPLTMWQWGINHQPRFYISAYFEVNREEYFDGLLSVSRDGDWMAWIKFFLKAITRQADENFKQVEEILTLYETLKRRFPQLTRSSYAIHSLDWIFENPIFFSSDFIKGSDMSSATARRLLSTLRDQDIIKQLRSGSGRRPDLFVFPKLLDIVKV